MSVQVANIDLSTAVVGTTGSIQIGQSLPPSTLVQQMNPQIAPRPELQVFNESGCGLTCMWPTTRETFTIPAGQWRRLYLPPGETQLMYVVIYVLPNAPVSRLIADLYYVGELHDYVGVLGNSPVNGGSVVSNGTAEFLQGSGQVLSVTELDTVGGNPMVLPLAAASSALELGARDVAAAPVRIVEIGASLGNEFTVLAGDGSGNQGTIHSANILLTGQVQAVNSKFTAGSFGVPAVLISSSVAVAVTTLTTTHTLATVSGGTFLVGLTFRMLNGTSPQLVTAQVNYTPGFGGAATTQVFQAVGTVAYGTLNALSIGNGTYACVPLTIKVLAGTTISIQYRDAGGTPADTVEAFIWQFA